MQRVCTYQCAIATAKIDREKAYRKETKSRKDKLKSRNEYIKEAQKAFNKYIRLRDRDLPCISCGDNKQDNYLTGSRWDCGHYRSVGANPELRFEPLNAARQCVKCNRDHSGNIVNYRIELEKRIGKEKLEWLEGPHPPKKYTIEDLIEIKELYKEKIKKLQTN